MPEGTYHLLFSLLKADEAICYNVCIPLWLRLGTLQSPQPPQDTGHWVMKAYLHQMVTYLLLSVCQCVVIVSFSACVWLSDYSQQLTFHYIISDGFFFQLIKKVNEHQTNMKVYIMSIIS